MSRQRKINRLLDLSFKLCYLWQIGLYIHMPTKIMIIFEGTTAASLNEEISEVFTVDILAIESYLKEE